MHSLNDHFGGWAATQFDACTRCGICAAACPFYSAIGDPKYTPVYKMDLLRRAYEYTTWVGKLKLLLRLEKPITESDLEEWKTLNFSGCSTCNRCSLTCPMGITIGSLLHDLRDRLAQAGSIPENFEKVRNNVQSAGNVYGYPADERAGWVDYMDSPPDDLFQRPKARVVYFVGCVSSFSPRAQSIAESFVKILSAARVDFTILGEGESCCGFPLRSAGLRKEADEVIQQNIKAVKQTGTDTIVFTCPACRLMWIEEYAPSLPGIQMLHSTELIASLIRSQKLTLTPIEKSVTYHDPCDLARTGGVYQAPRDVINAIPGMKLLEAAERRESGLCCGGGGDVEMVSPQNVRQVAQKTAGRLSAPGADWLVTACPQCMRVLEESMKNVNPAMKVLDIAEIVAKSAISLE